MGSPFPYLEKMKKALPPHSCLHFLHDIIRLYLSVPTIIKKTKYHKKKSEDFLLGIIDFLSQVKRIVST